VLEFGLRRLGSTGHRSTPGSDSPWPHAGQPWPDRLVRLSLLAQDPRQIPEGSEEMLRKILLLLVVAILAVVLSETVRNRVLDALFGAEEEFSYSPSTAPATPPPTE
jgi:hypothetical protein